MVASGLRRGVWFGVFGAVVGGVGLWLGSVGVGGSAGVAALTNCDVSSGLGLDAEEAEFLVLLNGYRADNGVGALTIDSRLNRPAQWLANDYATNGYLSGHIDHSGRGPGVRLRDCGWNDGWGEISLSGKTTAEGALELWKTSDGHNRNMLNASFTRVGIGHNGSVWVVDFGMGSGGTEPTVAAATPTRTPRSATPTRTATETRAMPTATKTVKPAATVRPGVSTKGRRYEVLAPGITRE